MIQTGLSGEVMTGLKRRRNPAMGLRMTAMIDVIFLLLTFFVLTARFKQPESYLNVTMPKPTLGTASPVARQPLSVRLEVNDFQFTVKLPDSEKIMLRPDTIEANLTDFYNQLMNIMPLYDTAGHGVELYCDDAVQWDYIVKVYDVLYRAGATKITFVTEEKILPAAVSAEKPL